VAEYELGPGAYVEEQGTFLYEALGESRISIWK
jgi:hypothetical protein